MSPQIDAIIYKGVPLLEFTDVAVVEKEQVKAIVEVKSWIDTTALFGDKVEVGSERDKNTGLAYQFNQRRDFLPEEARYILFTFGLYSGRDDDDVYKRLKEICNMYAIVSRIRGQADNFNFKDSVSKLIKWLRELS